MTKKDQYDDGYNISEDYLMTSALNKFEILRKYNKRNSVSPEQEQIISLASLVEKLKDDNLNLANNFNTSPPGKDKGKGKVKFKGKSQKQTIKQSRYGRCKEEWKKKYPKYRETNTKKVNGKTYYWCPNHQAWKIHSP